jgi:lysophospholipase L1-like esterase
MRRVAFLCLLAGCSSEGSTEDASVADVPAQVDAGIDAIEDTSADAPADGPTLGPAGPRFIGRFDDMHQSSWSHSAVALRFTGTDVSVTLAGAGVMYEVVLDGVRSKFTGGSGTYALGKGLANGPHDLLLVRRQESFFGIAKFVSFDVPQNQWLPNVVPSRRIEIVGDSISAGYGNEGCPFEVNENSDLAYGAVAARAVSADVHIIATSGIGMAKSLSNAPTMPTIYEHTFGANNATAWDFTKYAADVVVINLGTNDMNAGVDKTAYKTSYTAFLGTVRGHYPSARIYCVSMNGNTLTAEVQAVVATAADPKIAYLALHGNAAGCQGHPDIAGHQTMANDLEAALKTDLGW